MNEVNLKVINAVLNKEKQKMLLKKWNIIYYQRIYANERRGKFFITVNFTLKRLALYLSIYKKAFIKNSSSPISLA